MYLLTQQSISISRSAETVYQYAANMENFGEWFTGVLSIESANGLQHAECGKEYLETVSVPLQGKRMIILGVKEAQLNKMFVTEAEFPPLMPRMEISFQSLDSNSCSVTWRMFSRNNNLLARITLLPLAKRIISQRAAIGIKQLKQKLENPKG